MQFIYLILSIYLGRKNPLYYLIFPIALVSGPGALIDPRTVLVADDIFLIGKNIYKDVIIAYLFLVVFLLKKHWKINQISKSPITYYGLFITLLIIITYVKSGTSYEAINVMRLFTHIILGYFLLLIIFSTATSKQFISFFNSLFFVTGILSILYVINSAKILPIYYQENLYLEVDTTKDSFFRDFSTIPYFSNFLFVLALSFTLTQSKNFNRKVLLFSLTTYPFVLLYTFTRSLLTITLMECALIISVLAIKSPQRIFKPIFFIVIIAASIIVLIIQTKFQNELSYFSERVMNAKNEGADEENVQVRIAYHIKAFEILNSNNSLLIGEGINKIHDSEMDQVGAWDADSTIPFFLIYTGIFGVIIYYYIGVHFLFKTVSHLINQFNPFSLALFAFILSALISSLIMGGTRWGDPFIFFPFVLVVIMENF